jgi:hypothetical protein
MGMLLLSLLLLLLLKLLFLFLFLLALLLLMVLLLLPLLLLSPHPSSRPFLQTGDRLPSATSGCLFKVLTFLAALLRSSNSAVRYQYAATNPLAVILTATPTT